MEIKDYELLGKILKWLDDAPVEVRDYLLRKDKRKVFTQSEIGEDKYHSRQERGQEQNINKQNNDNLSNAINTEAQCQHNTSTSTDRQDIKVERSEEVKGENEEGRFCKHCNQTFRDYESVLRHLCEVYSEGNNNNNITNAEDDRRVKESLSNDNPQTIRQKYIIKCNECNIIMYTKEEASKHRKEVHPNLKHKILTKIRLQDDDKNAREDISATELASELKRKTNAVDGREVKSRKTSQEKQKNVAEIGSGTKIEYNAAGFESSNDNVYNDRYASSRVNAQRIRTTNNAQGESKRSNDVQDNIQRNNTYTLNIPDREGDETRLVVYGLKESNDETDEELVKILSRIFYENLRIQLESEMKYIKRLGKRFTEAEDKHRKLVSPVEIGFFSPRMTRYILNNTHRFNNTDLYIRKYISRAELEYRKWIRQVAWNARKQGEHTVVKEDRLFINGKEYLPTQEEEERRRLTV